MHAISFPVFGEEDLLTDETIDRLLESPYLTNIAAIQLIDQTQLTSAAYRRIVTAPTLPKLSLFYRKGLCAICGDKVVRIYGPPGDPYGDPMGLRTGSMDCEQCGTSWFIWDEAE